jgi:cytochrome d ubiquinol oxidase subunit II
LEQGIIMTLLAFCGVGGTIWPYAIPYHLSILEGAADPSSIKFALVGIVIVLPVVLTYQLYAYRVFARKLPAGVTSYAASAGSRPSVSALPTHEGVPGLHLS